MTTTQIIETVVIPVCLGVMGVLVLWLGHSWLQFRRAKRDFPSLASESGLEHCPATAAGVVPEGIGELRGMLDGHSVVLAPQRTEMLTIELRRSLGFHAHGQSDAFIAFFEALKIVPKVDSRGFDFGDRELDEYFRIRGADDESAQRTAASPHVVATLRRFVSRWRHKLAFLRIQDDRIECTPKIGNRLRPGNRYIAKDQAARLLTDALELATDLAEGFAA